jgi:hypothetical protein
MRARRQQQQTSDEARHGEGLRGELGERQSRKELPTTSELLVTNEM